jgi:low temperature requirement protein LtrA
VGAVVGTCSRSDPCSRCRRCEPATAGSVALWWCYFHRAEEIEVRAVQETDSPSRLVGWGNYSLIAMVIGTVAIDVGDELVASTRPPRR